MSGSLADEQAVLQANAVASGENTGQTITLAPGDLYPGSGGSVTDAAGNVYTLPQMDGNPGFGWVTENGQQLPNGNYTAALASSGGTIYAEDGKAANVYTWNNATGQFDLVGGAMPASDGGGGEGTPAPAPYVPPAPQPSPTPTPTPTGSNIVTPGNGSFAGPTPDNTTGTYSIDPNGDVADLNGQPITDGSGGTGVLQLTNAQIVGQDEASGNWFLLASKGTPGLYEWQPTGAPGAPDAGTPTATGDQSGTPSGSGSMQFISSDMGSGVSSTDFSSTHSCHFTG